MNYDPNKKPINQSRRPELEMDDQWIIQFLHKTHFGHIATRDGDQPFVIPTTFWYSEENNEIYFHSNAFGRIRFNADNYLEVCFECFSSGRLLPSNIPLEKSVQYESVMAFGQVQVIQSLDEKRKKLNGLLQKYFGEMNSGQDYRPITDNELKKTCSRHNKNYYKKYKKWCDKYFYLPHRKETRGIGGIFFDYKKENWEKDFVFVRDVGLAFKTIFKSIIQKKYKKKWSLKEKELQYIKRGRYAEFNLLYDRGTKFGLQTGGNVEGILMSLPPITKWK